MATEEQEVNALALILRTTIKSLTTFPSPVPGLPPVSLGLSEHQLARHLVDAGYTLSEKTNELALRDLQKRFDDLVAQWSAERQSESALHERLEALAEAHNRTHWCINEDQQPEVYEHGTQWWPCPTLAALAADPSPSEDRTGAEEREVDDA